MAVLNKQQYDHINGYRDLINLTVKSGELANYGQARTLLEWMQGNGFGQIDINCSDCIFANINLCDRLLKQYDDETK